MTRIPTPLPASVVRTLSTVFSGSVRTVLWRLLVLVAGAFAVVYLIAVSSSVVGYVLLFVLISFTLGALLKASARDIWTANFWRFKL